MTKIIASKDKDYVLVPRASFPNMVLGSAIFNRLKAIGIEEWPTYKKLMESYKEGMEGKSIEEVAEQVEKSYPVATLTTLRRLEDDRKVHTYIEMKDSEYLDPFFEDEDDYHPDDVDK